MKYKVWSCKAVVIDSGSGEIGDSMPRFAVTGCLEDMGEVVLSCFSGWDGTLTADEEESVITLQASREAREILEDLSSFNTKKDKLTYLTSLVKDRRV